MLLNFLVFEEELRVLVSRIALLFLKKDFKFWISLDVGRFTFFKV
jgi:hypothetical protein